MYASVATLIGQPEELTQGNVSIKVKLILIVHKIAFPS